MRVRKKLMMLFAMLAAVMLLGTAAQAVPVIASATLSTSGFKPGSGALKVAVTAHCPEDVVCKIKVVNSANQMVFSNTAGTGRGPGFVTYWDGRASRKNKAGLAEGAYAPKGAYKVKVILYYQTAAGRKYVMKKLPLTVKKAKAATGSAGTSTSTADAAASAQAEASADAVTVTPVASPLGTKKWPWVVQVTGNKKADYLAELICQEILKPSMSEYKRAKKIYAWVVQHFTREGGSVRLSTAGYKIDISSAEAKANITAYRKTVKKMIKKGSAVVNTADSQSVNGVTSGWYNKRINGLSKQVGDCTHAAAMYEILCRHAGLDCDIIENALALTNPLHHLWCVVKVDGKWYHSDPRMENARMAGTKVQYTMFLRGKKSLAKQEARYGMIRNASTYQKLYALLENNDYGK